MISPGSRTPRPSSAKSSRSPRSASRRDSIRPSVEHDEGKTPWLAVLGVVVLALYGVVATLQPKNADFGRVYAAYGGVF